MFKQLRRKFIAITMTLTSAVLIGMLGSTLWSSYTTQRMFVEEALDRSIENDFGAMPLMGGPHSEGKRGANILVVALDVSSDGVVLSTVGPSSLVNPTALSEVVSRALASDRDEGRFENLHVAWRRAVKDDGSFRVVMADTSLMDSSLTEQLVADLKITAASLVVMFLISWWLSGWALAPVSRAWEEQRRFVADASHELKTPLAVILANTEILARDEALPQESRRWVESTQDEAQHMKGLVNDLLELARADESATVGGASALHREEVNLSELVDAATLEFDAIAFERGCQIEADIAPDIVVPGDREWLGRVVRILVDNACKYAGSGTTIEVTLAKSTPHGQLSVTNQGPCIDSEDLPHVFDRFYRSDKARTRGAGGFGLGLAIAKSIVEAHGGKISVSSSAEAGTCFCVLL